MSRYSIFTALLFIATLHELAGACVYRDTSVFVADLTCFEDTNWIYGIVLSGEGQLNQQSWLELETDFACLKTVVARAAIAQVDNGTIPFTTDCRLTRHGREYVGQLNVTDMGLICQRWNSNVPHQHPFVQATSAGFPGDGGPTQAGNKCRNPDFSWFQGLWCYTMSPSVRWRPCNVPFCECRLNRDASGINYMGARSTTQSGRQCQRWSRTTPHNHPFTNSSYFPDLATGSQSNFCRNPNGSRSDGPWCYTTDPAVQWEYCNIPFCNFTQVSTSTTAQTTTTTVATTTRRTTTTTRRTTTRRSTTTFRPTPESTKIVPPPENSASGLSAGIIAAAVIVPSIVVVIIAIVVIFVCRMQRQDSNSSGNQLFRSVIARAITYPWKRFDSPDASQSTTTGSGSSQTNYAAADSVAVSTQSSTVTPPSSGEKSGGNPSGIDNPNYYDYPPTSQPALPPRRNSELRDNAAIAQDSVDDVSLNVDKYSATMTNVPLA